MRRIAAATGVPAHPMGLPGLLAAQAVGAAPSQLPAVPALAHSCRSLHTPPGGFDEALPSSFGRQSGKGELSNVNLRANVRRVRHTRRRRQRLRQPPTASAATPTLAQVKRELMQLVEKTCGARGEPVSKSTAAAADGSETFASPAASRRLPLDVASCVRQTEEDEVAEGVDEVAAGAADTAAPPAARPPHLLAEPSAYDDVAAAALAAANAASPSSALAVAAAVAEEEPWSSQEEAVERGYAVKPSSTIFGSDLDRLERDMMREYHERGTRLPPRDRVFAAFGSSQRGRRMQWEPSSSFEHLCGSDFSANQHDVRAVGDHTNGNMSAYHLYAEAYQTQQEEVRRRSRGGAAAGHGGINYCRARESGAGALAAAAEAEDLPAADNPHFPCDGATEATGGDGGATRAEEAPTLWAAAPPPTREVVIDARTDYKARLSIVAGPPADVDESDDANRIVYDAYHQRPTENGLLEVRGADYWGSHEHRRRVEERSAHRQKAIAREVLQEGAVDTSEVEYSTNTVRKETLLYFQAHPINEMIQEPFVRVREFMPPGGGARVAFNPVEFVEVPADGNADAQRVVETVNTDADIPVQEARRMARELGLDLIRTGALYSQKTDRRIVALCMIGDHREHLRDIIKFKIQKLGMQPPPTRECFEVPFKGGTHPHAIRFKCIGVAKHLLHRHAVRINLTKFGSPREGFPVFQTILDELKRQCMRLKAYHTAGLIQSNYDEIFCYLYPSTGRSPKTTVTHPTPQQVREARDDRILENEKEIYFDGLQDAVTQKERLQYMLKLENGTAWADKDEGLSLQKQRALKVMLGYLPKGNRELYAARGDVNIPAPFRASHPTSVDKWTYPTESNLEQASRGAATLGKRAAMPISEMHDAGETPENATQLDRFYYRVQGPALEVGEFKEALGLKDNRTRRPAMGSGFATIGTTSQDRESGDSSFATK